MLHSHLPQKRPAHHATPLERFQSDYVVQDSREMANVSDPFLLILQKPGMVPPPPGEESQTVILPPGWHSYLSPQGRRYYVNTTTNGESCSGAAFPNPQTPPLPRGAFLPPSSPSLGSQGFLLLNVT